MICITSTGLKYVTCFSTHHIAHTFCLHLYCMTSCSKLLGTNCVYAQSTLLHLGQTEVYKVKENVTLTTLPETIRKWISVRLTTTL